MQRSFDPRSRRPLRPLRLLRGAGAGTRRAAAWLGALTLGVTAALPARADPGPWELIGERDGVRVEQTGPTPRDLPRFRGTTEIEAPLGAVLPVVLDSDRHTEWMPECVESRGVRREGHAERIVYTRHDAPWPFSDRDAVLRSRVIVVRPGEEFSLPFESVEDSTVPPQPGAVRLPWLLGGYRLTAIAPERTRVVLEVEIDPGGRIPRFVLPTAGRIHAVGTLSALRRQVQATRGEYPEFMERFLASGRYERAPVAPPRTEELRPSPPRRAPTPESP